VTLATALGCGVVAGVSPSHEAAAQAIRATQPAADAPGRWAGYVRGWTAWNHVRTAAALAAAGALTVAVHVA
jgi:uncharacterized membrane protein